MDETSLFIVPNQTRHSARKSSCVQNLEGLSHCCSFCNMTCTDKLKSMIIYNSLRPRCFGRWLLRSYLWWFANQTPLMTSYAFESWMMSLNVHFKSQKRKVLLVMVLVSSSMLASMNHLVFQPCNPTILLFISYHLMSQVWCNLWIMK